MRYGIFLIFTLLFIGCSSHTPPKPVPVTVAKEDTQWDLLSAILQNDINGTKKLLESGINPNISDRQKRSAIEIAIRKTNYEIVEQLLKYGANPNELILKNDLPMSAVSLSATLKDGRFLKLLIKYGVDSKKLDHYYTLLGAIYTNRIDNLKLLLDNGFDINGRGKKGETLLMFSTHSKNTYKSSEFLIENGADINALNNKNLSALIMNSNNKMNLKNIELLLKNGANIEQKDKNGANALLYALKGDRKDVVKLLIKYDVDIKTKLLDTGTPLALACALDKYKVAKVLVNNLKIKDELYLLLAFKYGDRKMFNFLLDNGYKVKKINLGKVYINMYLANKRHKELQEYFAIKGFDTFELKYISKQAQKKIIKIMDNLYKSNNLTDKQKLKISLSLYKIREIKRAYRWFNTIAEDKNKPLKWKCLLSAEDGNIDMKSCRVYNDELIIEKDYGRLSWTNLILKDYNEVIKFANKTIDKNIEQKKSNSSYFVYSNLGHGYLLKGNKKKAYESYQNYFKSLQSVFALINIKNDFEMLQLHHPSKADLIHKAYKYCVDADTKVLKDMVK